MTAPEKLVRGMVIDEELKAEIERRYNEYESLRQQYDDCVGQLFEARVECKVLNNRLNNSKKYRARLEAAVNALIMASEEYDFDDGLGRGAPQQYWDALDPEVET